MMYLLRSLRFWENNHDLQTRNDRKIKAGHDKDHVYVIIRVEKNYLYLSDGDLKPLNQMKKKECKTSSTDII